MTSPIHKYSLEERMLFMELLEQGFDPEALLEEEYTAFAQEAQGIALDLFVQQQEAQKKENALIDMEKEAYDDEIFPLIEKVQKQMDDLKSIIDDNQTYVEEAKLILAKVKKIQEDRLQQKAELNDEIARLRRTIELNRSSHGTESAVQIGQRASKWAGDSGVKQQRAVLKTSLEHEEHILRQRIKKRIRSLPKASRLLDDITH